MTGTIINYKTENGIFKEFVAVCNAAFSYYNITGWSVRQLHQVLNVNVLKPTVFISFVDDSQLGAQYYDRKVSETAVTQTNSAKQQVKIRFSAAKKRSIKDDDKTLAGFDVLKIIRYFLQSQEGIKLLASYGYAQYRASTVTNQNFLDDSENIELMPFFECEFLYTNSWTNTSYRINQFSYKAYQT